MRNDRHAFAAVRVAGVNVVATVDAASIHHELASVGERVFHRVVVEVLVHRIAAVMAAAQRLGLDRPGVLRPAEMINMVDVKVAEAPTARPQEAVEALNLPEQFRRFAPPFFRQRRTHRSMNPEKWPGKPTELLWQIQRFHSFLWASGGCYSDFYIHVIDHCCWMKNAWPVK